MRKTKEIIIALLTAVLKMALLPLTPVLLIVGLLVAWGGYERWTGRGNFFTDVVKFVFSCEKGI